MRISSLINFHSNTIILLIGFFLYGCEKTEGPGGTSTIKGKIIVHDFDAAFQSAVPISIFPAIDHDIFILYGLDHTTYDDDYKTSYDGSYEFKYLQKGHYRLFAYSKDSTGAKIGFPKGDDIPVFIDVEITSNGTVVIGPDLIILDNNQ